MSPVPPPFTSDMAKDWRTPDGARPVSTSDTSYGSTYVEFDKDVHVTGLGQRSTGYTYFKGLNLSIDADGKHNYSDLQLVYDPLCLDCGEPLAAHEAEDQPNDLYLVVAPDGWDLIAPFTAFDDAMAKAEALAEANAGVQFHVALLARLATVGTEQITVTTFH